MIYENNINFGRLEKYKTPKDYFRALDDFKRDPSNIKGGIGIVLTNPLCCFMEAIDWECGAIINQLKLALDFVKRKRAGENTIDDAMINNNLEQANQRISYLARKIKRGYWGYKWELLSEIRKVLSSLSSSVFLKTIRSPLNYVPEEFDLIEKDLKTLNDIHFQHIEFKEAFNERLKRMSFEQAVEILRHLKNTGLPMKDENASSDQTVNQKTKDDKTPKVFISYSHDTPEHKKWVLDLANRLLKNGVDVILDQWDLSLGGDVAKFMESSTDADRVLMICTELYVKKADEGKGGVGYEAMIVTGELMRNLGTTKFIPVIRQNSGEIKVPKSVSTRAYIDLSNEQSFEQQFECLLRDLHQVPAASKPPLGKSPFIAQPSSVDNRDKHNGPWRCNKFGSLVGQLASFEFSNEGVKKTYRCDCGGEFWPAV
jgi:hypothetical protein